MMSLLPPSCPLFSQGNWGLGSGTPYSRYKEEVSWDAGGPDRGLLSLLFNDVWLCATPWTAGRQALLSLTISQSVPKFIPLNLWCYPTISSSVSPFCLQSSPASGFFSDESALLIKWPKCWSFNFSITPSKEYSGLISFRIGWFDLFVVQGTLKRLLQHHIGKHQFFGVQPSLWSNSHVRVWLLERPWLWLFGPLLARGYPPPVLRRLASGSEEVFLHLNHLNFLEREYSCEMNIFKRIHGNKKGGHLVGWRGQSIPEPWGKVSCYTAP